MKPQTFAVAAILTTLSIVYFSGTNEQPGSPTITLKDQDVLVSATSEQKEERGTRPMNEASRAMPVLTTTSSSFRILSGRDTLIYARRGTGLHFPANAFTTRDGSPVSGRIRIVVEECYDVPEILAAKLSTSSNGKLLETSGMIRVRAFSDRKEELVLNEGKRYIIYFPNQYVHADDFQLFYGQWNDQGIMNWTLASEFESPSAESNSIETTLSESSAADDLSFDQECMIQITESYFRRGTRISKMDYFNWQLTNGQTLNQWFVSGFNPDIEMVKDFCDKELRSEITFKVNNQGAFESYFISHSDALDYDRKIAEFLRTMPPLDLTRVMPEYTSDHSCKLTFSSHENSMPNQFVESFRKKNAVDPARNFENVTAADMDYYVFSSSELGWINCDRFVEPEESLREFVVQNPGSDAASVSMVFSDINSVLKGEIMGDLVVFEEVPKNRRVKLICIDNQTNTPLMSIVSCNTSQKEEPTFPSLRPFCEKDLREQFRKESNVAM